MEIFGLELRKINNINNLYRDVDTVLKGFDINKMKKGAVAHSLHKMLQSEKYFNICTIRECMKVSQIAIPQDRLSIYETQHCISWSEMLPDFRQVLIAMVLDDFRSILFMEEK